jgi:hypothetical protein
MATRSLSRYPSTVMSALVRNAAREGVKHNIRAQGLKIAPFLLKDITRMAEHRRQQSRRSY